MKFGAMVVPRASDWWLFAELEQMSYDSAWVPDSQTIYSDTYAVLALAAANTSRIRLGPRRCRRAGDCCAAGFRPRLCRLRVLLVFVATGSKLSPIAPP